MAEMNFLELVRRTHKELGYVSTAPDAVTNQTGRAADVVDWVKDAHEEIQTARPDWNFDWASGTFTLTANDDLYEPEGDFSIVGGVRDFDRSPGASYSYPTASGANARTFMQYRDWESFRSLIVPVTTGSQPTHFSLRPDGYIQYWPKPTVANTAVHEYWRNPQVLAANADVPRMPEWSHMAIVWKAVMIGCRKTRDFARMEVAEEGFNPIFERLIDKCTPKMGLGGSLA